MKNIKLIKLLGILVSVFLLQGCTDSKNAKKALRAQGFNNITITGYKFFGCSDEDIFHTGFEAVNSKGSVVTGTVCSGVMKGSTIRY